jgi:hypothetical protein
MHLWALGGITHAEVGDFDTPGGGAADQDVTTSYGTKPDLVILFTIGTATVSGSSGAYDSKGSYGFANKDGEQACISQWSDDNVTPTNNLRQQRTDACIHIFDGSGDILVSTIAAYGDWPADGFRVSHSADTTAVRVNYIALWGVDSKIASVDVPTSTGNQAYDISFNGTPAALFLASSNQNTVDGTKDDDALFFMGFTGGVGNEGDQVYIDEDGQATSDTTRGTVDDACIHLCNTTPAVDARADLVSFDDGGFTLDWTTAPGSARKIIVCALATPNYTAEGDIDFAGALTHKKRAPRTLAGALNMSGALSHKKRAAKTLAGALDLAGALGKKKRAPRTLAGAVSFAGALSHKKRATRTLEGTVTLSGELARKKMVTRAISGEISFTGTAAGLPILGDPGGTFQGLIFKDKTFKAITLGASD